MLFLVWRYLWYGQRSVVRWLLRLSFGGLVLGGWAWIVVASVFNGFEAFLEEVFQRADPHVRLVGRGLTDSLGQAVAAMPEVKAVAGVYERIAILRYGMRQAIVRLRLVPASYPAVSQIGAQFIYGEGFPLQAKHLLIGAGIAARLAILESEEPLWVYVIPSGRRLAFTGVEGLLRQKARVQGIFSVQKEYDESWVIALADDWKGVQAASYETIEIRLHEGVRLETFLRKLRASLPAGIEAQDPRQQHQGVYRVLAQEKLLARAGLIVLLILTASGVISTFSAFFLLTRRDWALYQALGAPFRWNTTLSTSISLALLMGGSGIGILLGTLTVILQERFHWVRLRGGEGFLIEHFPVKLSAEDYVWFGGLMVGLGVLLAIYTWYQLRRVDLRAALQGD